MYKRGVSMDDLQTLPVRAVPPPRFPDVDRPGQPDTLTVISRRPKMLQTRTFVAPSLLEVPLTVNEGREGERRELMFSDRKASRLLGITILRAPKLTIDQKASKTLGTDVIKPGVDRETRVNGRSTSPGKSRFREKFLTTKIAPLILKSPEEGQGVSRGEGQKVVLSPKWKSFRKFRRHTISYESGLGLPLPSPASSGSQTLKPEIFGSTKETFGEVLKEDGGGEIGLGLYSGELSGDTVSETATLVDPGIISPQVPSACPPSPVDPQARPQIYGEPVSPTRGRNPVLQKRKEMVRSANKSVQILGTEARRAILKKMEKENEGRIGWSGI